MIEISGDQLFFDVRHGIAYDNHNHPVVTLTVTPGPQLITLAAKVDLIDKVMLDMLTATEVDTQLRQSHPGLADLFNQYNTMKALVAP